LWITEVTSKESRNALDDPPFEPTVVDLRINGLNGALNFCVAEV
jgi:hypothetical protein